MAVNGIIKDLERGMDEQACQALVQERLSSLGVEKKWHPTKFRIGADTLKSFSEKSDSNQKLENGEIFFIDIGPVWDGYEGDFGKTFVFGEDIHHYQKLADAAQKIFDLTGAHWKDSGVSGGKLYEFAKSCAKDLGYELNEKMDGHRLGDFPHHLFYRGGLAETDEVPVDNLWVLEILIRDDKSNRGAFFEDILSQSNFI